MIIRKSGSNRLTYAQNMSKVIKTPTIFYYFCAFFRPFDKKWINLIKASILTWSCTALKPDNQPDWFIFPILHPSLPKRIVYRWFSFCKIPFNILITGIRLGCEPMPEFSVKRLSCKSIRKYWRPNRSVKH